MDTRHEICGAEAMEQAISKMANSIEQEFLIPQNHHFVMVGIQRQGVPLAERLASKINKSSNYNPPLAQLDISMYRDDIGQNKTLPVIYPTSIPFDINDKIVILVDDVLASGRTIRAALDALTDYGRPKLIRLAVLVDRGDREFPIQADYMGLQLTASPEQRLRVCFSTDLQKSAIYRESWNKAAKKA